MISKFEQKSAVKEMRKQLKAAGVPAVKWSSTNVRGFKRIATQGFDIYSAKHPDYMHQIDISFPSDADRPTTGPEAEKLSKQTYQVLKRNGWKVERLKGGTVRVDLGMDEQVWIKQDNHLEEKKFLKYFGTHQKGLDAAMKVVKDTAYHFVGTKTGALVVAYDDKKKGEEVKKKMKSAGFHVDTKFKNNKLELGITWVMGMDAGTSKMFEDMVGTGDMAGSFSAGSGPAKSFKGMPCFELGSANEYNSFCKGIKTFKRWSQHTKSEGVRQWANANKGKSFYVSYNENYTYIDRSKK